MTYDGGSRIPQLTKNSTVLKWKEYYQYREGKEKTLPGAWVVVALGGGGGWDSWEQEGGLEQKGLG